MPVTAMDDLHEQNLGGTTQLLRYFQERSDDITKVVIPQHPYIELAGKSGERTNVEAGLIIHLLNGDLKIVPNRQDAEAILNDGILTRMKIRIELGV